jgi:hypothetical protein
LVQKLHNVISTTMEHLLDDGILSRIEVNLAESRSIRAGHGNIWFNVLCLLVIVGSALLFMYTQYNTSKNVLQPVNIPKTELIWNNSIRNRIDM